MADTEAVLETAPAPDAQPEKAAAPAPDAPAPEPRARRERKQADFFTPDEPKGDGQKRAIPEVRLRILPSPRDSRCYEAAAVLHRTMRAQVCSLTNLARQTVNTPTRRCDRADQQSSVYHPVLRITEAKGCVTQGKGTKLTDIPNGAPFSAILVWVPDMRCTASPVCLSDVLLPCSCLPPLQGQGQHGTN